MPRRPVFPARAAASAADFVIKTHQKRIRDNMSENIRKQAVQDITGNLFEFYY